MMMRERWPTEGWRKTLRKGRKSEGENWTQGDYKKRKGGGGRMMRRRREREMRRKRRCRGKRM